MPRFLPHSNLPALAVVLTSLLAPRTEALSWLTETGAHRGFLVRASSSLNMGIDVRRETRSGAMAVHGEDLGEGLNLVVGHSIVPRWNLGVSLLNSIAPIETGFSDFSWGPNLIVYGPLNSHLSGYYGWSLGDSDMEGGGDIKGQRWSLALGKELLFAERFGIGLALQYQSGSWEESFVQGPPRHWEASGTTVNLTLTLN